ncbi:CHASE2 domain-containing protein [Geomonas sp. Red32]|uniref:CHASE2 domain-containing protein n=1 Tax=Geomonas sp. Red32 TaxID=2912856 RepID=UPI00202CDB7E|nr:CHASE2 domain-containing protein [Geomonas sp. Red32]MCM0082581.1 CHASE2 domain-containing protein [Geomonas sp. Red32]
MPEPLLHKRRPTRRTLWTAVAITLAITASHLAEPSPLAPLHTWCMDAVLSLAYRQPAPRSVVIADVDERSLARYGRWPWPRETLARVLDTLKKEGAACIGLDMVLAEPERGTSPGELPERGAAAGPARGRVAVAEASGGGEGDRRLAEALAGGGLVTGYEFLFDPAVTVSHAEELHPPGIVEVERGGHGSLPAFFAATSVVANQGLFSRAVRRSGFLNATPDPDGVMRRMPMMIRYRDRLYPSLSLALLMSYQRVGQLSLYGGWLREGRVVAGSRAIPVDSRGNLIMPFSRPGAIPRISAADLLEGKVPRERVEGKLVVVGASAAGLAPLYQTPAGSLVTHAELHAEALESLLSGRWAIRNGMLVLVEALAGILVAAACTLAVVRAGILASLAASVSLVTASWYGAVLLFDAKGYLFSPLLPSLVAVAVYAVLTVLKAWDSQAEAQDAVQDALVLLKSSEKNLSSIIKTVPDIIFRLDKSGRITFISPAIARYTDAGDSLIGVAIFDLVVPEDLPKARYRLNEKRTGTRATRGLEVRLRIPRRQPGEAPVIGEFDISAEGLYRGEVPAAGEFIGTQGIMHDISAQKKLEEELVQAQKMEAIGHLAAGVAHDLNNILMGLVTYPDLLLLDLPPESPLREKIALLQKSGHKAAAIVQDLLTLGRRGVKNSEPVSLNAIVSDYLASIEFQAGWNGYRRITLEKELGDELLSIRGSKVHLAKVLMNLLNNAAEAMPGGGVVRVETFNRYLDGPWYGYENIPPGEYVCLAVADQGVGISAGDLHRVFEPFFSSKTMGRSGSGLGMTVIWATVKDHGGFVDLTSREGEGTRMELYFPATREAVGEGSERVVLESYLGSEKVLVVDDAPDQLAITSQMLAKLGYAVTALPSGEAAVEYLKRETADLVVLDMVMPGGMDGLDSYRKIVELRPGQRAIVTSGYCRSERIETLHTLGVEVFLPKPYTLQAIGVAVRRELDRAAAVTRPPLGQEG